MAMGFGGDENTLELEIQSKVGWILDGGSTTLDHFIWGTWASLDFSIHMSPGSKSPHILKDGDHSGDSCTTL